MLTWPATEKSERNAIIDFYVDLAGDREGRIIATAGESVAASILQRLDGYSTIRERQHALLLVEEIRRGHPVYKASFVPKDQKEAVENAVHLYKTWFQQVLPWDAKRRIEPLHDSGMYWSSF